MAKLEVDIKGLKKLNAAIQKAARQVTKVGVLAGATYPSGTKVDQVAEFLEFGWDQHVTEKQRRWFGAQGVNLTKGAVLRCPSRPFFRATLAVKEKSWRETGNAALRGLDENPINKIHQALVAMGLVAQQDLKDTILEGAVEGEKLARRSELTLLLYANQAQGHRMDNTPNQTTTDKPLYRSGLLASSIVFDLENSGKGSS